jgi:hypothetical protein
LKSSSEDKIDLGAKQLSSLFDLSAFSHCMGWVEVHDAVDISKLCAWTKFAARLKPQAAAMAAV